MVIGRLVWSFRVELSIFAFSGLIVCSTHGLQCIRSSDHQFQYAYRALNLLWTPVIYRSMLLHRSESLFNLEMALCFLHQVSLWFSSKHFQATYKNIPTGLNIVDCYMKVIPSFCACLAGWAQK